MGEDGVGVPQADNVAGGEEDLTARLRRQALQRFGGDGSAYDAAVEAPPLGGQPREGQAGTLAYLAAGSVPYAVVDAGGEEGGFGLRVVGEEGEVAGGGGGCLVLRGAVGRWEAPLPKGQAALQPQTPVQPVLRRVPHGEVDAGLQVVREGAEDLDLDALIGAGGGLDGLGVGGKAA